MIKKILIDIDSLSIKDEIERDISQNTLMSPLFFDEYEFHEYHSRFAEEVFLAFVQNKNKIIGYFFAGKTQDTLRMPYSSPFSLIYLRKSYKISDALIVIRALKILGQKINVKKISLSLPPDIYDNELVNILTASFASEGFSIDRIDINNHFDLSGYTDVEAYLSKAEHKTRKNYKNAIKNELEFSVIKNENFEIAYSVIEANRNQKGYPLKISKSQMVDLLRMESIHSRCFGVFKSEICVAAAIVFDITDDISQVIYWGDNLEFRDLRPMDLLTLKIFDYYKDLGKRIIDIGPSSEDGIINGGLADFKQSIGCLSRCKYSFKFDMDESRNKCKSKEK